MKKLIICLQIFMATSSLQAQVSVDGSITEQGEMTHLEFTGNQNWIYQIKKVQEKNKTFVDITVDSLSDRAKDEFKKFKSALVKSINIDKATDGKSLVRLELSQAEVESFDYLTDQPSRLIVDLYVTEENQRKARAKARAAKVSKEPKDQSVSEQANAGSFGERKPASDVLVPSATGPLLGKSEIRGGLFDGSDPTFERFSIKDYEIKEEAIIRSKDNFYIPFPMLEAENINLSRIQAAAPIYNIAPKDSDENKQARLLQTLFEKKRYNVYLKTLPWFKEKYPNSEYNELIDYMTGDVQLHRWRETGNASLYELAMEQYNQAIQKYPNSPLAERTSLMKGYLAFDRGDLLAAIRYFKAHQVRKFDNPKEGFSKDLAKMGESAAYSKLHQYDAATKALVELEKSASTKELQVEAAYRLGDIHTLSKKWPEAITDYQSALNKYPESRTKFPGAYYNMAESLFQIGKHRQSLDVYRDFIKQFPMSDHAPYAMTRLGEILEILGADRSKVMGAYLETYFRYGENPRAIIARLRMLSARMKGMKDKEVEVAVKDIMSLTAKTDLPGVEEFSTVLIADGYSSRGEYQRAADMLVAYYQKHPTTSDKEMIKKRVVGNANELLFAQVEKGDFISALSTHRKWAEHWLKGSDRLDTKYFLARSFELAGTYDQAENNYKEVLNKVYALKGSSNEKILLVMDHLPSLDQLNLRLAAVASAKKEFHRSYEYLKNIKVPEKMTDGEQIERVTLTSDLLERRGDVDSSMRYLSELLKTFKGQPELVGGPWLKLANLEIKAGKVDDAILSLEKIDTLMTDSKLVKPQVHAKALELLGNLYLQKKSDAKAVATYAKLLEMYESSHPLASVRYKLGMIHFSAGETQKASEAWNTFKGEKTEFWKKLAQEQLKNADWNDEYKKYIKRIPAMSERK